MERDCQFMVVPPPPRQYDEATGQFMHQLMVAAGDLDPAGAGRGGGGERKRRFTEEQVRSLETTFHARRAAKLEPREKAELARELGLQPRQVSIWFQNKRARWRSKQLEHDYAALRAQYDSLHARVEALRQEKLALAAQVDELRGRLNERRPPRPDDHSSSGEVNCAEADDDKRNSTTCSTLAQDDNNSATPTPAVASSSEESAAATADYYDHVAYDDGLPEPFCATPDLLWDTWPLLEWNAVA